MSPLPQENVVICHIILTLDKPNTLSMIKLKNSTFIDDETSFNPKPSILLYLHNLTPVCIFQV